MWLVVAKVRECYILLVFFGVIFCILINCDIFVKKEIP